MSRAPDPNCTIGREQYQVHIWERSNLKVYLLIYWNLLAARITPASPSDAEGSDHSYQLALLAAIVASSDYAIVSKTLDGRFQWWNASATRIFGYQPDEVVGKPITINIPQSR
jgi:PAS domain-containing protein